METNELLEQARSSFFKEYAQTPEEAGFSVIKCWNKEVVFAKNEQVFTALQKSQKLIKQGLNAFLVIIILWVAGFSLSLALADTFSLGKFPLWIVLVGMLIFFVLCAGIQLKCNQWEAVYIKEGCHLIYNGKRFYAIKDEPVNSHTAFF